MVNTQPSVLVRGWRQFKAAWYNLPQWAKWVGMLLVLAIICYFLYTQTDFITKAFQAVKQANYWWILACVVASFASMLSFAAVQWTLLRAAGVHSPFSRNCAIVFASNALSGSIPGGPVLGTALTYRETKRLGASTIVATWQVIVAGVLATVGLILLSLGGFIFLGTVTHPVLLILSVSALVVLLALIHWAMKNPTMIEAKVLPILVWWAHKRHKDPAPSVHRLRNTIHQVEAVRLRPIDLIKAFAWSLFNWVTDIACMGFAAYAVGAHPSIGGISIAYVSGKIVGSAPVTPGGLGTVDGALVWALTLSGLTAANALATVLIYRLISFVLMILIGWMLVVVLFRGSTKDTSFITEYEKETAVMLEAPLNKGTLNEFELAAQRHRRVQERLDARKTELQQEAEESTEFQERIDRVRTNGSEKTTEPPTASPE